MARYFAAYFNAGSGLYEAVNSNNADKSFTAVSGTDANGQAALLLNKSGKFISFPVDGVGAATFTTPCVNTDSNIIYTAKTVGPGGTSIRVRYVVAGNNTALSVSVSGNDITVNVATSAGGAATSTATLIKAAVDGNGPASALVSTTLVGTGAGIVNGFGYTNLTDGSPKASLTSPSQAANGSLVFTANAQGSNANSIRVRYVVAGANTPLTIAVAGNDITVNVATSAGSAATSTASQILTALNADASASALILTSLAPSNDGTGVAVAFGYTNLTGGQYGGVTATTVQVAPGATQSTTTF